MLISELSRIEGYVDPVRWLRKPDKPEIGAIVERIPHYRCEFNISEWADIFKKGHTVLPSILSAPRKLGENVTQQQMFLVDFDHNANALSPCMTIIKYRNHGVYPAILYHSMNSSPRAPRYRIVVVTSTPAVGPEQITTVYSALMHLATPEPDPSSGDLARMFFGASSSFPLPVRRLWEYDDGNGEAPTVEQLIALAPTTSDEFEFTTKAGRNGGKRRKPADEYLIANADLLEFVRQITGERGIRKGNSVNFHKCPICNHFDHFVVSPDPNGVDLWTCFGSETAYKDKHGRMKHPGGTIVDLIAYINKEVR